MAQLARDLMTADPQCCSPETSLYEIARMMVDTNCGEIPIVEKNGRVLGVITDRDIVCRAVAKGKNPLSCTAAECMTTTVFTVDDDTPIEDVIGTMEAHQIRRVPVLDGDGCCAGIIAQADLVNVAPAQLTSELLSRISRVSTGPSA